MKAYVTRNAEGWMRVFPMNWEVAFDARNGKTLIVKVYDVAGHDNAIAAAKSKLTDKERKAVKVTTARAYTV